MNTPRSDKAWEAWKKSGNAQHIRSESCRLETELAEVTKELAALKKDYDVVKSAFRKSDEQWIARESELMAKLEKCRTALESAYQVHRAIATYSKQSDEDRLSNEAHCNMMKRVLDQTK